MTQIFFTVLSWIITSVLGAVAAYYAAKWKAERKKEQEIKAAQKAQDDAQTQGMVSLLRAELIRQHDKWTERGYCPIYAKEAAQANYDAYHKLGGNGVITKLYQDVMALPEEVSAKNKGDNKQCGRKS